MGQKAMITHTKCKPNMKQYINSLHEWNVTSHSATRQVFYYLTLDKNFSLIHQLYNHKTTAL